MTFQFFDDEVYKHMVQLESRGISGCTPAYLSMVKTLHVMFEDKKLHSIGFWEHNEPVKPSNWCSSFVLPFSNDFSEISIAYPPDDQRLQVITMTNGNLNQEDISYLSDEDLINKIVELWRPARDTKQFEKTKQPFEVTNQSSSV